MSAALGFLLIASVITFCVMQQTGADQLSEQCQLVLNDRARFNETLRRIARILKRPDWSDQIVEMMRQWYSTEQLGCNRTPTKPSKPTRAVGGSETIQLRRVRRQAEADGEKLCCEHERRSRAKAVLNTCNRVTRGVACAQGYCHVDKHVNTAYCYCPPPYHGPRCELPGNDSSPSLLPANLLRRSRRLTIPNVKRLSSPLLTVDGMEYRGENDHQQPVTVHTRVNVECDETTRQRVDCDNGAKCYAVPSLSFAFCRCPAGFTGSRCEGLDIGSILLEFDQFAPSIARNNHRTTLGDTSVSFRESYIAFSNAICAGHPLRKCIQLRDIDEELQLLNRHDLSDDNEPY